ncbi:phosphodiester glycosidase family protein [Lampropedia aestuarii]|uniref:phosphodiester glycosidase family protein n=1 Tax=Lampropedia aestuarii TaxID=2562762 RepID=UPI00246950FC|nr:phosphodiester glycosidase family protein [Lampropedia aestuarii]MDH5858249.1 phosphodiester glycosidase family protein [Lampropedia aestuarii]
MLRYFIFLVSIFSFSSSYSFENRETFSPAESKNQTARTWECWGVRTFDKTQVIDNSLLNDPINLRVDNDICVSEDSRPLVVDIYLKNARLFPAEFTEVDYKITVEITHNITENNEILTINRTSNNLDDQLFRFEFSAIRSGDYKIDVKEIHSTFKWFDSTLTTFEIESEIPRNGTGHVQPASHSYADLMALIYETKEEVLKTGQPSQIIFGEGFEIPMTVRPPYFGAYTSANRGSLLILPYEFNSMQFMTPHLLGDTHQGDAARCENNPNARTSSGELQKAELYTPEQAWKLLNRPLVALNANYFDTRPQLNNTTWRSNLCSTPLGIYFDNIPNGPTNGTHNEPNVFFPGPKNYIGNDGTEIPLDAMFWTTNRNNSIDIIYSQRPSDPAIEQYAFDLASSGYQFIAVAGSGLPVNPLLPEPTPDSGTRDTTRIAIGKPNTESIIYIFQGGEYVNGVDRIDLQNLFYGLDTSNALELDGGGSSALAIDSNAFTLKGANRPASSCNTQGLRCSLITQPSGDHRPIPSWIGLERN